MYTHSSCAPFLNLFICFIYSFLHSKLRAWTRFELRAILFTFPVTVNCPSFLIFCCSFFTRHYFLWLLCDPTVGPPKDSRRKPRQTHFTVQVNPLYLTWNSPEHEVIKCSSTPWWAIAMLLFVVCLFVCYYGWTWDASRNESSESRTPVGGGGRLCSMWLNTKGRTET